LTWTEWKKEVRRLLRLYGYVGLLDLQPWRQYWEEGYSPKEAVDENESYGGW